MGLLPFPNFREFFSFAYVLRHATCHNRKITFIRNRRVPIALMHVKSLHIIYKEWIKFFGFRAQALSWVTFLERNLQTSSFAGSVLVKFDAQCKVG